MSKRISYLVVIIFSLFSTHKLSAQATIETGHEALRGEFNFTALADSYAHHPPGFIEKEMENDEAEVHPVHAPITDPSLLHGWTPPPATYSPGVIELSPAPTDTFESTLDNNTAFPPDTHGAVDSTYCMTTINTDVHIQTRAGATVGTAVSLDAFFHSVAPSGGTYDPRCHYDIGTHRWIVVADDSAMTDGSSLLIAISKTGDPTGSWWTYKIIAYAAGGVWLDFPDVGFNSKWVAISGNLFPNTGTGFDGCKFFAFDKASLFSGAGAPYTAFTQASSACICPAITYDATEANLFAMETWNGGNTGGGVLQLWEITGAVGSESMTSIGFPEATGFNWQNESFAVSGTAEADFAPQVGSANLIQTNDDRIAQLIFMNGKLWCSQNVFLPYSTTANATRSSVQWWQTDTFGNPIQVGLVDDATNTNFYAFPSISVNTSNDALLGFSAFSATTHPGAAYAMHLHTDALATMEAVDIFRHGTNTYYKVGSGTRNRWGDFSGCVIDPINNLDFWTIQEATASPANTFDTWWANVKPCNPPGATITAAGATTFCAGGSVLLNANTGTGYMYQWELGGSVITGATNSSYTASAGGNYSVIVTVVTCTDTSTTTAVVVNTLPAAAITPGGPTTFCTGGSVTLTATAGVGLTYQWKSGGAAIGGATSASYTATTSGNYTVFITNSSGCSATSAVTTVTVGSTASPITGAMTVCPGATTHLSDVTSGGTWSTSNAAVATVSSGGIVSGVTDGTAIIEYSLGTGCTATTTVTVSSVGSPITGVTTVCDGSAVSLSDGTSGGTWSSSNTSVASVGATTGIVTGVSDGTATIAYTVGTGCISTALVTVTSLTSAITGVMTVCAGATTDLADATTGGSWSSSNLAVATVGASTGIVTGVAGGTATISYTLGTGCTATTVVTVNATSVPAIAGTTSLCTGQTITLTDATTGGTWSSSVPSIATINATSGLVTAVSSGSTTISYTISSACGAASATQVVTVSTHAPNTVTVLATHLSIVAGSVDTFVAIAPNGGTSPIYQWMINGTAIPGATSSLYITDSLINGQIISCKETTSDECASPSIALSGGDTVRVVPVGVQQVASYCSNFTLIPNPNRGEFTIEGSLKNPNADIVNILMVDMLGQVIYRGTANAANGKLYRHIVLDPTIANGNYLVNVTTGADNVVYHVVINR